MKANERPGTKPYVTLEKGRMVEIPRHPKGRPMYYTWVQGWHDQGCTHDAPLAHWRISAKDNGFQIKFAR